MKTIDEQREDGSLERLARSLPDSSPPDELWSRIEAGLRKEQSSARTRRFRFRDSLNVPLWFSKRPSLSYVSYGMIVFVGILISGYLLFFRTHPATSPEEFASAGPTGEEMLLDAQDDIDQAIYFYERAIDKLTKLADRNAKRLNPQFVQLQNERIEMLKKSIIECKAALAENKSHPQVQHYLLVAYNDLQNTLQELATKTN
jgi:hypothetical protein